MLAIATTRYLVALLALALTQLHHVLAQQGETVWSAVVITIYGDRIPLLSSNNSVMTPLGAQQMYSAGSLVRDRYIAPSNESLANGNHTIAGISPFEIDISQVMAFTTVSSEVWIDQSTLAFMSGLYPPVNGSSSDGRNAYPMIVSASPNDPSYVYLSGMESCPSLDTSANNYFQTPEFNSLVSSTKSFYQSLSSTFKPVTIPYDLSFADAYRVWDYLSYEVIHDNDIASTINSSTVDTAHYLANALMWDLYANSSADNGIRIIAGRTLLAQVLNLLANNIESTGTEYKLTPLFTSFQPMMALASVLGLTDLFTEFFGMPNLGSSMIFEMYTNSTTNTSSFPTESDLYVRFMFRNGTSTPDNLASYPILGNDRNQMDMSLADFANAVEAVAVDSIAEWCALCSSEAIFCTGVANQNTGSPSGVSAPSSSTNGQVPPVVAGVIGAMVALAVAGLVLVAIMLLFGVRFRRERTKRRAELGGFKGSEKLASDPDLPKGGATVGASIIPDSASHKRIESWELKEGQGRGRGGRPSFERDGESVHAGSESVKAMERV